MLHKILKILLIFLFGALGGVWAQASLLPFLAEFPVFQDIGFIRSLENREVIINPTQTITVQENTALTRAIERVEKTIVGIKTETVEGRILEGSGLVVTSDGLIVTLASLVPQGSDFYFYVDGQWPSYQILKRDLENNIALVKISKGRLNTAGFTDLERIKLGERAFLLGMEFKERETATTTTDLLVAPDILVDEGIISSISQDSIQTNIYEARAAGSPLFDIEGNVIGLSMADETGRVSAVPISIIRNFIGL